MRIGELSERTGTSRRLLRYYEEQGLIASSREPNGYRDYAEAFVDRVMQIRGLLAAGLPTRIIKQILPCLSQPRAIHFEEATPEMLATLEEECDRMTERIRCLERNRDAVSAYLAEVRRRKAERVAARTDTPSASGGASGTPSTSVGRGRAAVLDGV
ncbi:MerR family transcriptional regulator [Streptomyces sp. SKN60]|uniref:MerR family transcriptional regulator n=1 Tax=Streptomyces sp. SKN60 TaxID=2855506 RepID=UPI00224518B7|nr:MerR family transcriptional regulator [Streptomyces sp. SKN60]MCX2183366.1 MerR family transcriptional regulator [Streptomyces sp. SKN60]